MKKRIVWITALLIGCGVSMSLVDPSSAVLNASTSKESSVQSAPDQNNAASVPADQVQRQDQTGEQSLEQSVRQWVEKLSGEAGFESWNNANWKTYPLGPGSHGWVVLLYNGGKEVGYIIVGATPDGKYTLEEYGVGEHPLFSFNTLYQSMIQQELISSFIHLEDFMDDNQFPKERLYISALAALWKMEVGDQTYYFDAKTGEMLPLTDADVPAESTPAPSVYELEATAAQMIKPSFDPLYRMNWIVDDPLPINEFADLHAELQQEANITYVAKLYDDKVIAPFAVVGYQQWDDYDPFVVLDQDGLRYIPYPIAAKYGKFYR